MWSRVYNKCDYSKSVHGTIIKGLYEICVMDCYKVKDQLKAMGYKWDGSQNRWSLTCKTEDIGNAIVEMAVKINLPRQEYKQMIMHLSNIDIDMSDLRMDEEHTEMIVNHYKK